MPTFNCAEYIEQAVRSILIQSYSYFELIIIDDGSTDNTKGIIESIKDSRIRYYKLSKCGISNALNFGIEKSKYNYIARMDADDIALPERFENQVEFMELHKNIDVLSCAYASFINNRILYVVNVPENNDEITKKLLLYPLIFHPGMLARKEIFYKFGNYHSKLTEDVFEDYQLWLRLKNKVVFHNINKVLMLYRYRSNSLSRENIKYKNKLYYSIQENFYNEIEAEFGLVSNIEIEKIKGWREYFFGDKKKARRCWMNIKHNIFSDYRIISAYLLTFCTEDFLQLFKNIRFRFRCMYYITYFSKTNKNLRNYLKKRC